MAIFHGLSRPRTLDEAVHSGDNALNVLLVVLLIVFSVASWYFYATPMADRANIGMATISAPAPSAVNEGSPHPSP